MKKKILTCLAVLTLFVASGITVFAAPEIMPDGGVFDAEYYAENNPDVVQAFGTDKNMLYSHYVNCGKAEGRKAFSENSQEAKELLKNAPYMSITDVLGKTYEDIRNMRDLEYIKYLESAKTYGVAENAYRKYSNKTYGESYAEELNLCNSIGIQKEYLSSFETFLNREYRNVFYKIDCGGTYDGIKEALLQLAKNRMDSAQIRCFYEGMEYKVIQQTINEYMKELEKEYGMKITYSRIEKVRSPYSAGDSAPDPEPGYNVSLSFAYN